MLQPTPSQPVGALLEPDSRPLAVRPLAEIWPFVLAALGSSALLFMMFQPWMRASGWDGVATVNAFGRISRTSSHLNLWAQSSPPGARIGGLWGILATIAIVIVVCAASQSIRRDSDVAAGITAGASAVVAVLVLVDVLNLDSKIPQVQASLSMAGNDLGPQLGLVLGVLRGKSSYPWPGESVPLHPAELTPWAFTAIAVAFASAAVAVSRSWRSALRGLAVVVGKLV
ncbi:hypothetical protein ACFXO9_31180 [Nocardia tengchongensis]|uniref:hypothetical protein n=1 Tax=Nocardia tengchongensis TaxID=2055889 RepID=UPI003677CD8B